MCTLLILFRPKHEWPLIIGGNRDEMISRKWLPPSNHWNNNIIGGKDIVAGGTWLGINKNSIVATILNRTESLGFDNKLSRGNLVINILKNENLKQALSYLLSLNPNNWKPFNLFIADYKKALWIKNDNSKKFKINIIKPGIHFLDSHDLNSLKSPRYKFNIEQFKKLKAPDPNTNSWDSWKDFLSNKNHPQNNHLAAINIINKNNYGTLSTNFIALPKDPRNVLKPIYLFNDNTNSNKDYYSVKTKY